MTLDPNEIIAGLPARQLRGLLHQEVLGEMREANVVGFLNVSKAEAKRVLDGLMEAGLVEWKDKKVVLTRRGKQARMASLAKRVSRTTADRVLAETLARIETINQDARYAWKVGEAFVFGSYLSDAQTLGDLDLAIAVERRCQDDDAYEVHHRSRVEAAIEAGRRFGSIFDEVNWPHMEVWLAIKKRSRTLSLHEAFELEKLGTPYVRIYPQIESETVAKRVAQARQNPRPPRKPRPPKPPEYEIEAKITLRIADPVAVIEAARRAQLERMDEPIPDDLRIESVEDALIELGFRGLEERLEAIPGVDPQGGECGASRVAGKR